MLRALKRNRIPMKDQVIRLLGQTDYFPLNVPELLRRLRLPPHRQQELQVVLKKLEQSGESRASRAIVTSARARRI